MGRRPGVTILMLIITIILTLPLKSVGPSSAGPGPDAVRPYMACAGAMPALSARVQNVAPGLSPARAALKGGSTTASPPAPRNH